MENVCPHGMGVPSPDTSTMWIHSPILKPIASSCSRVFIESFICSPLPPLLRGSTSSRVSEKIPDGFPSVSLFLEAFVILLQKSDLLLISLPIFTLRILVTLSQSFSTSFIHSLIHSVSVLKQLLCTRMGATLACTLHSDARDILVSL